MNTEQTSKNTFTYTKFQVSSIILTSFTQVGDNFTQPLQQNKSLKSPLRLGLNRKYASASGNYIYRAAIQRLFLYEIHLDSLHFHR